MGADPFPPVNGFAKSARASRSQAKAKSIDVQASKATSVRDIKVEILQQKRLTPILQKLLYKGRELDSEETLDSIGFLAGDEMTLIELEEDEEIGDHVRPTGEGFGGTALSARIGGFGCLCLRDRRLTSRPIPL